MLGWLVYWLIGWLVEYFFFLFVSDKIVTDVMTVPDSDPAQGCGARQPTAMLCDEADAIMAFHTVQETIVGSSLIQIICDDTGE